MWCVAQHVATRDLGGLADDIVNIYQIFLSYLICFTYMPYCFICLYSLYDMLLLFYWIFFGDVCCEHMCRLLVLVCINKHTLAAIFPPLPISSYWPVKNCISSCVRLDGMLLMDWPTCVLCSFHVSYNAV